MLLQEKTVDSPHICGIDLATTATESAAGNFDIQPFYNTNILEGNFSTVYFSKGSASFSETSSDTANGVVYTQKVSLKFPSNDIHRSKKLEELRSVRFMTINFSNNTKLLLGRNDFFQNTDPSVKISSNEKITTANFIFTSVFPAGFFENTVAYGFVYELPISFLESI